MLVEMEFILVSMRTTRLSGIELIVYRNVVTAAQLYARKIACKPKQLVCISRRKVGMHKFRAVLDIYASLSPQIYQPRGVHDGCTPNSIGSDDE